MKNLVLLSKRNSKWYRNFQWNREAGACCVRPQVCHWVQWVKDLAMSFGIPDCMLGAWLLVWVCFLNVRIVSLPWINTLCNLLYRCARGFPAFTICHINPYSSVNVWRGYFRGPLGENMNVISRGNALKDEKFVYLSSYFRSKMLMVRVTRLNSGVDFSLYL